MTFNPVLRTVSLALPASKCDPTAIGVTITHGCCCSIRGPWSPMCPYHLAADHFAFLMGAQPGWFDSRCNPLPGVPLFPCCTGGPTTKRGVIGTIRRAAMDLGQPLREAEGL